MSSYLTPGVYFEFIDERPPLVAGIRTDIAGFLGITERGPIHEPVRLESWAQFQSVFGDIIENGFLAYSVKAFFENGGQTCHVIRVAADTAASTTVSDPPVAQPLDRFSSNVVDTAGFAPSAVVTISQSLSTQTSGPQPADRMSSLVTTVVGFSAGSRVKLTQAAAVAICRVKAADLFSNRLLWDQPLDSRFDLTQTILLEVRHQIDHLLADATAGLLTWERPLEAFFDLKKVIHFATGQAPAVGELPDENGTPTLRIRARSSGSWGNELSVQVGRSHQLAFRTRAVPQPANRTASLVETVTGLHPGTLVKIFQEGAPQPVHRLIHEVQADRRELVWDQPLDAFFNLPAAEDGSRPISMDSVEFALSVYRRGTLLETHPNLSLVATHPRHVVQQVRENSHWISVDDLQSLSPLPQRLPDPSSGMLHRGRLRLSGGRDGVAALDVDDYTGDPEQLDRWGLRLFEEVDEIALLAIPDAMIVPLTRRAKDIPPPPLVDKCLPWTEEEPLAEPAVPLVLEQARSFALNEIAEIQSHLVRHCELLQDRLALLDPPPSEGETPTAALDQVQSWRQRIDSSYSALYFPWIGVLDPLRLSRQEIRMLPPSGHVAGIFARTDRALGVHKAPANEDLNWVQALAVTVTGQQQGILNPEGINVIRLFPGRGIRVYGARTTSREVQWRFVNVRRLLMMIEEALVESSQWAVFENNDYRLRQTLRLAISSFLRELWQKGALVGANAQEAFFVKCDEQNNPPSSIELGQLVVDVGVAPVVPAEFVIFRIGRTEGELRIEELQRS